MPQFQPMEKSTLIICQVLFENILDKVYEALVNIFFNISFNSCGGNIFLSDDVGVKNLIKDDVLS